MTAATAWEGELTIGECWAQWRGRSGDNRLHRHLAAQAVRAPSGIRVEDAEGRLVAAPAVLIDPLTPHRLLPADDATLVYVEPAAPPSPALGAALASFPQDAAVLATGDSRFWPAGPTLAPPAPLVAAARARIDAALEGGRVTLAELAAAEALSPDRFRHRFAAEAGLPLRRYVLWRRLRRAALAIAAGERATGAAHAAGFADSAHFARTLAVMFGVTASAALLGRNGSISCAT